MSGIVNLNDLLQSMAPQLKPGEFVFCKVEAFDASHLALNPLGMFKEQEATTLILDRHQAEQAKLDFEGVFKQVTLTVHSSLEAVGLTAAIATKLASYQISANVVAGYYHDHIFVPVSDAERALEALHEFTK